MQLAKVRQDAWSHEDDLLLAETVLRHIREGSTQLNAFEEVGDKLNRTSAACGFRWNAEVRNKYINAIDLAKRQRKERKRAQAARAKVATQPTYPLATPKKVDDSSLIIEQPSMTLDHVIQFLSHLKQDYHASNQSKEAIKRKEEENTSLLQKIDELEKELDMTRKKLSTVEDDYKVFIQIMERARKMTVLEDQGSLKSPSFRMDKNGNLEQLVQGSN